MPANFPVMSLGHLRALLHSDTDLVDDWESALFEVARKAREALRASRALVALPEGDSWRAFVDSGQVLAGAAVSLVAMLAAAFADGPGARDGDCVVAARPDRPRQSSALAMR